MKSLEDNLNKIKDQVIYLVEKYNFITSENLELKREISKLTEELEKSKKVNYLESGGNTEERMAEIHQKIDQCLEEIRKSITLVRQ